MNKEIINQLKSTKTVDELKGLASKNGYHLDDKEAKNYFDLFHKEGKIADEELNNVAGGLCRGGSIYSTHDHHYLITTIWNTCSLYKKDKALSGIDNTCSTCLHYLNSPEDACHYCTTRTYEYDKHKGDK